MRLVSFLYKLLFNIKNSSISHNQEELFHSDIFLRPNKTNYKTCPKCKKTAKTNKEIVDYFGIKLTNRKTCIQSWCKDCRKQIVSKSKKVNNQQEIIERKYDKGI